GRWNRRPRLMSFRPISSATPSPRPQGAERAGVVEPVNDGKDQPLQRQDGGGGKQRRQRTGRHIALQIAAGAGVIDAPELQQIVAPGVIEFAGAERVVLLVAMLWRGVIRLLQCVRAAG